MRQTTTLCIAAILVLAGGQAAADAPRAEPKVAASINGSHRQKTGRGEEEARLKALQKAAARPTARRVQNCKLSADEELLVSELRAAMARLETRQLALDAREAALRALQSQIAGQMEELRSIQRGISTDLDVASQEKASARKIRIGQLAGIIKKMKPNQAAPIVARQSLGVAVAVLEQVGAKNAGRILANLPPTQAVRIAEKLVSLPVEKEATP